MQIYYASLEAIDLQTRQLEPEQCPHCRSPHQLISHGFIYKKCAGSKLEAVGKRVFCSNRRRHTGCGRTSRLYLETTIRYLHYASDMLVAFALALLQGLTIGQAYRATTGTADPRHAYRWLSRMYGQLSTYRSLAHQAPLPNGDGPPCTAPAARRDLLGTTLRTLLTDFGAPLCAHFQGITQRSFM